MSKSVLDAEALHDEEGAYKWVEARLWPNGPVCPHCKATDRISKMRGESTRIGTYKCYHCRKKFTVKVRTVFEDSHVPMHLWLQAVFLMGSSKKGVSANQLHRTLGVTLKTAWFMARRIPTGVQGRSREEAHRSNAFALRGSMAKAGMAAMKPKGKKSDKTQSERFKETARELGCDESPGALKRALRKINVRKAENLSPRGSSSRKSLSLLEM